MRYASVVSSAYEDCPRLAPFPSFADSGRWVEEGLADPQVGWVVNPLVADSSFPERLDAALSELPQPPEWLLLSFHGYVAWVADRPPALLLSGPKPRAFPIRRFCMLLQKWCEQVLTILELVPIVDAGKSPAAVADILRTAFDGLGVEVLLGVRADSPEVDPGGTTFGMLVAQGLDRMVSTEDGVPVTARALFRNMVDHHHDPTRAWRLRHFPAGRDFVVVPANAGRSQLACSPQSPSLSVIGPVDAGDAPSTQDSVAEIPRRVQPDRLEPAAAARTREGLPPAAADSLDRVGSPAADSLDRVGVGAAVLSATGSVRDESLGAGSHSTADIAWSAGTERAREAIRSAEASRAVEARGAAPNWPAEMRGAAPNWPAEASGEAASDRAREAIRSAEASRAVEARGAAPNCPPEVMRGREPSEAAGWEETDTVDGAWGALGQEVRAGDVVCQSDWVRSSPPIGLAETDGAQRAREFARAESGSSREDAQVSGRVAPGAERVARTGESARAEPGSAPARGSVLPADVLASATVAARVRSRWPVPRVDAEPYWLNVPLGWLAAEFAGLLPGAVSPEPAPEMGRDSTSSRRVASGVEVASSAASRPKTARSGVDLELMHETPEDSSASDSVSIRSARSASDPVLPSSGAVLRSVQSVPSGGLSGERPDVLLAEDRTAVVARPFDPEPAGSARRSASAQGMQSELVPSPDLGVAARARSGIGEGSPGDSAVRPSRGVGVEPIRDEGLPTIIINDPPAAPPPVAEPEPEPEPEPKPEPEPEPEPEPALPPTPEQLGDQLLTDGQFEAAVTQFGEVLSAIDPSQTIDRARLLAKLGDVERRAGREESALARHSEALELDPLNLEALFWATEALYDRQEYDRIERLLERRLEGLTEPSARLEVLRALVDLWLDDHRDLQRSRLVLNRVLKQEPEDQQALEQLIEVLHALGEHDEAIRTRWWQASLCSEDRARHARLLVQAANAVQEYLGDVAYAVDLGEQALNADPRAYEALELVANLLVTAEDWEHLARLYEAVLEGECDDWVTLDLGEKLGVLYRDKLENPERAAEALERGLAVDRTNARFHLLLGETYTVLGDPARALTHCRAAIREQPEEPGGYQVAYELFNQLGELDGSWLAASVLDYLGDPEINQSLLANAHRPEGLLPVRAVLSDQEWDSRLLWPDHDLLLRRLLALVSEVAIDHRLAQLERENKLLALDSAFLQDPALSTTMLSRTMVWAARLLGVSVPALYVYPTVPSELGATPARQPTVLASRSLGSGVTLPELAFLWARHLASLRRENSLLLFFPTVGELGELVTAAFVAKDFSPRRADFFAGPVRVLAEALHKALTETQFEELAEITGQIGLAEAGKRMVRWARGIEFVAARVGLLAAGDIAVAGDLTLRYPVGGQTTPDEQKRHLLAFSLTEEYLELRRRLGVALEAS
ncbi:tetratricopeptide repeat protein [Myxococcota bacterium]